MTDLPQQYKKERPMYLFLQMDWFFFMGTTEDTEYEHQGENQIQD